MKRLSGWARLWIVILVPVWALSTWGLVDSETRSWRNYGCDWNGCPNYRFVPQGYDAEGEPRFLTKDIDNNELATLTGPDVRDIAQRELRRRAEASDLHSARLRSAMGTPLIGVIVAFALAMIAKSAALWVWRGFRPES